jgi:hypothetical protein
MTINELSRNLIEAYSVENLNKISLTLLNLFKCGEFSVLQKIAMIISDYVNIEISDEGKGFSKFMMMYHPDRSGYHIKEVNRLTQLNDFDGLLAYSHILKLERIEEIAASLESYEDVDYSPVYEWDINMNGFSIIDKDEPSGKYRTRTRTNTDKTGYSFYQAIKLREYGDLETEYPYYYLEDADEFELSASNITDLDGIQYCINAKTIDLSCNRINDITLLTGLTNLEELDLSDNPLELIDALGSLKNLKVLKLADNLIADIAPLFELNKLEYLDIRGNPVGIAQIRELADLDVNVDF